MGELSNESPRGAKLGPVAGMTALSKKIRRFCLKAFLWILSLKDNLIWLKANDLINHYPSNATILPSPSFTELPIPIRHSKRHRRRRHRRGHGLHPGRKD